MNIAATSQQNGHNWGSYITLLFPFKALAVASFSTGPSEQRIMEIFWLGLETIMKWWMSNKFALRRFGAPRPCQKHSDSNATFQFLLSAIMLPKGRHASVTHLKHFKLFDGNRSLLDNNSTSVQVHQFHIMHGQVAEAQAATVERWNETVPVTAVYRTLDEPHHQSHQST